MNRQSTINPAVLDYTDRALIKESVAQAKQVFFSLVAKLRMVEQVRAERAQLATLNPRLLRDIGVDNASARQESARGAFDLPSGRL